MSNKNNKKNQHANIGELTNTDTTKTETSAIQNAPIESPKEETSNVESKPITNLDNALSLTKQEKNVEGGNLPKEFTCTLKSASGLKQKTNLFHAFFTECFNAGKKEISNIDIFNAMKTYKISSGLKKNDTLHKWHGNKNMFGNKPAIFADSEFETSNCAENFLWINRRVKVSDSQAYVYGDYTYRLFNYTIDTVKNEAIYTLAK